MASAETAPPARLKARYLEEIRPCADLALRVLLDRCRRRRWRRSRSTWASGWPRQDSKVLKAATEQLATIAGQQPSVRRARKSIAAFKLREGNPVGVAVTLRGERGYEFLDRLVSIAIPRIRDFRGLNPRSFDGRGNYSMGVKRADHLPRDRLRRDRPGTRPGHHDHDERRAATSRPTRCSQALGMPFSAQGRPKGYDPRGRRRGRRRAPPRSAGRSRRQSGRGRGRGAARRPRAHPRAEAEAAPEPEAEAPSPRQPPSPRRAAEPESRARRGRRRA